LWLTVVFGLIVLTNIGRAVLGIVIFTGYCAFGNVCFQHFARYESAVVRQMMKSQEQFARTAYPDHELE